MPRGSMPFWKYLTAIVMVQLLQIGIELRYNLSAANVGSGEYFCGGLLISLFVLWIVYMTDTNKVDK